MKASGDYYYIYPQLYVCGRTVYFTVKGIWKCFLCVFVWNKHLGCCTFSSAASESFSAWWGCSGLQTLMMMWVTSPHLSCLNDKPYFSVFREMKWLGHEMVSLKAPICLCSLIIEVEWLNIVLKYNTWALRRRTWEERKYILYLFIIYYIRL